LIKFYFESRKKLDNNLNFEECSLKQATNEQDETEGKRKRKKGIDLE
jgi:hypothetical protein